MDLISVEQAVEILKCYTKDYGIEQIAFEDALGRVLAEPLYADRDLPPFNRATVDGIAIKAGILLPRRTFDIKATQAAGELPKTVNNVNECIEIMTGAAVAECFDAVVRYEDIVIRNGVATLCDLDVKVGMNIHLRGKDKKKGELVALSPSIINAPMMGLLASIGKTTLKVKRLPRIAVISTGDEMVPADTTPSPYQLRRSNGVVIQSVLDKYKIQADRFHLNDDIEEIRSELSRCLKDYDVLLMSGGVSMGKFDYVPQVLTELRVQKLFHKVKQRPGKPFWLGIHENKQLVFAFPGNPVSVFMCLHRYFVPWLFESIGIPIASERFAKLDQEIRFTPPLQYFAQVKLHTNSEGALLATPFETNGSGDFSNLIYANGFIELPLEKEIFKKGELYQVWPY